MLSYICCQHTDKYFNFLDRYNVLNSTTRVNFQISVHPVNPRIKVIKSTKPQKPELVKLLIVFPGNSECLQKPVFILYLSCLNTAWKLRPEVVSGRNLPSFA